ncbi:MAG: SDR family NAD(P)-dependent oxidoreductase [Proteobacteria bacterium]|nr:SDR family NAD(P)-dependent oxidoreductase [Pseudomonadota bacterium]MBU1388068.1 SDR family NAD(P)-dependent oxidoreductase [Pseudomonadota bacterium]MBU1542131.1 SDR family NAD(P)-dependent oxidoreductase [Pseudomonadota bacterium]MBU2482395.1 SDR family NAD(P)-dependent oxidoreductase [Pseudomonadota bacterium]
MTIRFDNRVALVTGAGAGIGRSYAMALAAQGAMVVVNDPGISSGGSSLAMEVVREIHAQGGQAVFNCDSVADRDSADRIVATAMENFGQVDILINNAGILRDKSFIKMPLDDFEDVLRVHLMGAVYLTKAAFPFMRKANYGRILFTTSTAGLYGNFGQTNYAAAKLALVGLMNALKLEGGKYNILVNTIAPIAATGMAGGTFPEEISSQIKPELVAAMALYLVSDQCRTSGKILSAGGGYYSSVQMMEGKGVRFESGKSVTADQIAERFTQIISMTHARPFKNATENVLHILSSLIATSQNIETNNSSL